MGDPPSPRMPDDTERGVAEADTREKAERAAPTLPPKMGRPDPARSVPPDPARAPHASWRSTPVLAAAAVVLVTVGFLAGRSQTIAALLTSEPPATPHDLMANLREKAFAACAQKDFGGCEMSLDEAQKSDPSGEADPRVVRARAAILRHKASLDCERLDWDRCREKLDLAKTMDPAGEDDPDVKKMRAGIATATATGTSGVKEP